MKKTFFYIIAFVLILSCLFLGYGNFSLKPKHTEKYVANNEMRIFIFTSDSLFIDNYDKGNKTRKGYCIFDKITSSNGETLYGGFNGKCLDTILVRVTPDLYGNHWCYEIRINEKGPIYADKVN